MGIEVTCAHCGNTSIKETGAVNRARKAGLKLYCTRQCAGQARRVERSADERKQLKAQYDAARRVALGEVLREKKRAHFKRTYDRDAAREYRKTRMSYHVEYCRRYYADPTRKRQKVEYDIRLRGAQYADYFESWRLLVELQREIRARMPDRHERAKARGYYDKFKERKHVSQDREHA